MIISEYHQLWCCSSVNNSKASPVPLTGPHWGGSCCSLWQGCRCWGWLAQGCPFGIRGGWHRDVLWDQGWLAQGFPSGSGVVGTVICLGIRAGWHRDVPWDQGWLAKGCALGSEWLAQGCLSGSGVGRHRDVPQDQALPPPSILHQVVWEGRAASWPHKHHHVSFRCLEQADGWARFPLLKSLVFLGTFAVCLRSWAGWNPPHPRWPRPCCTQGCDDTMWAHVSQHTLLSLPLHTIPWQINWVIYGNNRLFPSVSTSFFPQGFVHCVLAKFHTGNVYTQ